MIRSPRNGNHIINSNESNVVLVCKSSIFNAASRRRVRHGPSSVRTRAQYLASMSATKPSAVRRRIERLRTQVGTSGAGTSVGAGAGHLAAGAGACAGADFGGVSRDDTGAWLWSTADAVQHSAVPSCKYVRVTSPRPQAASGTISLAPPSRMHTIVRPRRCMLHCHASSSHVHAPQTSSSAVARPGVPWQLACRRTRRSRCCWWKPGARMIRT